jgi:hypothetical protein
MRPELKKMMNLESIERKPLQSHELLKSLACVSLAGFMVTFGGIHFNFLSLGKQDSTVAISARKNMSWHESKQVRHIFIIQSHKPKEGYNTSWDSRGRLATEPHSSPRFVHKFNS